MDFTGIIKSRMQEAHVTPAKLAGGMGFTVQYIYKLLAGKKRWNMTTMSRACQVLGLEMDFTLRKTGTDGQN